MKIDVLAIGAHPDDIELGCGATIAKEINLGRKAGVIDLTRGELGTRGSADIRDIESEKAKEILNLSFRINLDLGDGFFENNKTNQIKIIEIIRQYKPDIVLINPQFDRHIDHGKASKLASDACFLSGLRKIETKYNNVVQEQWRPKNVYRYIQWQNIEPDFVVDVTGYMDKKKEAVMAYSSQFYDPNNKEPNSPISSKNFLDSIEYRAQDLGRIIGVKHAEGFNSEKYIAVEDLSKLI